MKRFGLVVIAVVAFCTGCWGDLTGYKVTPEAPIPKDKARVPPECVVVGYHTRDHGTVSFGEYCRTKGEK